MTVATLSAVPGFVILGVIAIGLCSCGSTSPYGPELVFQDGLGVNIDGTGSVLRSTQLTLPYVVGARIPIWVTRSPTRDRTPLDEAIPWIESSDSGVFAVEDQEPTHTLTAFVGKAISAGSAELIAYRSKTDRVELGRTMIRVEEPDRIRLDRLRMRETLESPSWPVVMDWSVDHVPPPNLSTPGSPIRILEDSADWFVLRYRQGEQPLWGAESTTLTETEGDIEAELCATSGGTMDVVRLYAPAGSTGSVEVRAGSVLFQPLQVAAVAPSAVVGIDLWTAERYGTIGLNEGSPMLLVATGRTGEGEPVFGTAAHWTVDGANLGTGSMVRYSYAPERSMTVEVRFGDASATTTVHGTLRSGDAN